MCEILNDVLFCFIPLSPGPSLTLSGSEALRPRLSQAWEVSEKNMRRKAAKFFPLSYVLSVIQKREECSSTHTHTHPTMMLQSSLNLGGRGQLKEKKKFQSLMTNPMFPA